MNDAMRWIFDRKMQCAIILPSYTRIYECYEIFFFIHIQIRRYLWLARSKRVAVAAMAALKILTTCERVIYDDRDDDKDLWCESYDQRVCLYIYFSSLKYFTKNFHHFTIAAQSAKCHSAFWAILIRNDNNLRSAFMILWLFHFSTLYIYIDFMILRIVSIWIILLY